jgi:hypothetical protein
MSDFDLDVFKRQLAETIAWCTRPSLVEYGEFTFRKVMRPSDKWLHCIREEDRQSCVQTLFEERAKLLQSENITISPLDSHLSDGRLLAVFPDWTLDDGVAWVESLSFFDAEDFPAWDTWVYYGSENWDGYGDKTRNLNYLISWVPPQWFHYVENVINTSGTEHIQWLTNLHWYSISCRNILEKEHLLR